MKRPRLTKQQLFLETLEAISPFGDPNHWAERWADFRKSYSSDDSEHKIMHAFVFYNTQYFVDEKKYTTEQIGIITRAIFQGMRDAQDAAGTPNQEG